MNIFLFYLKKKDFNGNIKYTFHSPILIVFLNIIYLLSRNRKNKDNKNKNNLFSLFFLLNTI